MRINKTLGIFLLGLTTITFANDTNKNISKLKKEVKKYEQNISKAENKESVNDEELQALLKNRLSIISGKTAAIYNVSTEFNYFKSSIYQVYTKPNFTTVLKLNADESLVYVGGGDTENWQIDETSGGSDSATFLFVKPLLKGLRTNLNVITDKRSYFISLESTENEFNPYIQWKYPYENNMVHIKKSREKEKNMEISLGKSEDIRFGFKYDKNHKLAPEQVFTDKEKTILMLNDKLQEAPVVYVYGEDNALNLVNYRVIGNKIIIDKVVNKFQLVLGNEKLDIAR
ncbi:TrbG/VirB9 family P-type conjugative transfer protein [Streptobacillus moniliformis]|uniref:TrbG/VirB9 family P-type conjugative transfer protein n=1 Tax=Streptobacillus moniliformis TaxID=34105 RepID=UPI0007E49D55|nr:TrbG/VirB9 family P-type conjugative transfer protein [Streptobacillus moniliformis]